MFTHTTLRPTHLFTATTTTWRPCLKLLVPSKYHLTTNPCQEAEEVLSFCLLTLALLLRSPVLVAGPTTNGSGTWFSITNFCWHSTLAISKLVTSHSCSVPNSLSSTTYTQGTKPNSCALNGLMSLRNIKLYTSDTQRSRWST